jgi:hypothetical protein
MLIIGGGGAGGYNMGGGGGAGNLLVTINQTLSPGTYKINVGKGQTATSASTASGTGYNSEIYLNNTILNRSLGGGSGGASISSALQGGCGGGAGGLAGVSNGANAVNLNYYNGALIPYIQYTAPNYASYGYKGGNQQAYYQGDDYVWRQNGAGGGGIFSVGGNNVIPNTYVAGAGGSGTNQITINNQLYNFQSYFANGATFGVNGYIGGGGGGAKNSTGAAGAGGAGGGGGGGGGAGTDNTGSGGGGGTYYLGGNGGSGIIILRIKQITSPTSTSSIELL